MDTPAKLAATAAAPDRPPPRPVARRGPVTARGIRLGALRLAGARSEAGGR